MPLWVHGHEVKDYPQKGLFVGEGSYHILQFEGPILNTWKEELRSIGIKFYDYLPKYAFIVKATEEQLQKAYNKPFVLRIIPMLPQYKLPKDYKSKLNTCYIKQGDLYKVRVLVYEPHQLKFVQSFIQSKGFKVEGVSDKYVLYVQANLPLNLIHELTNLDFVKFVEFRYPIVNWNNMKAVNHQVGKWIDIQNITSSLDTIVWMKGLHGEGEILGHNDDGLDRNHCFFSGNVNGQPKIVDLCDYNGGGCGAASLPAGTACNTNPQTGCHGTHTAGTAVGWSDATSTSSATYRGLAYMARIVSQAPLGGGSGGFGQVLQDAYDRGARVHTNSWGYICPGFFSSLCAPHDYNTDARAIDNFVWNNPDMVVVFAAGNHGDDSCLDGCSRAASDPATAKSDITVGAMARTIDAKMGWSAYGNYPSGEFSIDIMAIGDTTYSAWGGTSCSITDAWWWMGTSMATPAVAGAALLIRQYYREGWYGNGTKNSAPGINPSAALVRASILASAVPITRDGDVGFGNEASAGDTPVPNGNEGAGRLVLDNFMYFEPEDSWNSLADSSDERKSRLEFWDITPGLNTGEADTFKVYIVNPNMVTRFVLSWSDFPGSTGCDTTSAGCLVNDLDLIVVDSATGDTWYGNVQTTGADNLTPANTGSPDRANTWELVRIKNRTGTFYIIVSAFNVPQGPQPYAVVVSGGLGDPTVTPLASSEKDLEFDLKLEGRQLILTLPYDGNFHITMYDVSGKEVLNTKLSTKNGKASLKLNNLPSGTYFVNIYEDKEKLYETKLVIY